MRRIIYNKISGGSASFAAPSRLKSFIGSGKMKRFISLFLSVLLALSVLPAGAAFASEETMAISAGQSVTVKLDGAGDVQELVFKPVRDGEYRIFSQAQTGTDPYCLFLDSAGDLVLPQTDTDDTVLESGRNFNFDFTAQLSAGEAYTIACGVNNASSAVSYSVSVTELNPPAAPDAVGGLKAQDITQTGFTVVWEPSAGADSYVVYDPSTDPAKAVTGITECEYTVTGLKANTQYEVRVLASNQGVTSAASTVTVKTLGEPEPEPEPVDPPTAPTGYNVYARGDNGTDLYLEWNANERADGYRVYITNGNYGEPGYQEILKGTTTENRFVFTDLTAGWDYRVMVVAFNDGGSASSKVTVCAALPRVEGASASRSGGSVTVKWQDMPCHGYVIQWGTDEKFASYSGSVTISGSAVNSYTIKNAPAGTCYVRVRAWRNFGSEKVYGEFSSPAKAGAAPLAPSGFEVYARGDNGTDLYLRWNGNTGADTFRVYIYSGTPGTSSYRETLKGVTTENRYVFTDLTAAWEYNVMVVAANDYGTTSARTMISAAPQNIEAAYAITDGSAVNIMWDAVACHGYVLQWSKASDFSSVEGSVNINGSENITYTLNLADASEYYVRVRAFRNSMGEFIGGGYSPAASLKTLGLDEAKEAARLVNIIISETEGLALDEALAQNGAEALVMYADMYNDEQFLAEVVGYIAVMAGETVNSYPGWEDETVPLYCTAQIDSDGRVTITLLMDEEMAALG